MISVVIPALNEEKFLPDCLESLRDQDYSGDYEIIVADNGSTDSTASIARSFGARVVNCPEKRGVSYARQAGAGAARGDIIAQTDADTIYPRDWLRRIAAQLALHPGAVAIAGKFIYRDPPSWAKIEYFFRHGMYRLTTALFGRPLFPSAATFAFRSVAFLAVNGYENIPYSPDQYGISARLSRAGKVLYDKDLCVLTSSRAVRKPFVRILLDFFLIHLINGWSLYLGRQGMAGLRRFANARRSRRIAFRSLLVLAAFSMAFVAYGYFIPTSPVFGKVYYEAKTSQKVVALTFDDGPNDPYTSEVLDILDRYEIKATFFVIGKNVELYPETARRIVAEGHVLGNHSYSHNANHALSRKGSYEIKAAQDVILRIVGVRPHLYRPPHGKKSPWELRYLHKQKLVEITWSVSTNELHSELFLGQPKPETVADNIVKKVESGGIILLHDGYGTRHNDLSSDKSLTVKALPKIIEELQARGYRFVTVPDLLGIQAYD